METHWNFPTAQRPPTALPTVYFASMAPTYPASLPSFIFSPQEILVEKDRCLPNTVRHGRFMLPAFTVLSQADTPTPSASTVRRHTARLTLCA